MYDHECFLSDLAEGFQSLLLGQLGWAGREAVRSSRGAGSIVSSAGAFGIRFGELNPFRWGWLVPGRHMPAHALWVRQVEESAKESGLSVLDVITRVDGRTAKAESVAHCVAERLAKYDKESRKADHGDPKESVGEKAVADCHVLVNIARAEEAVDLIIRRQARTYSRDVLSDIPCIGHRIMGNARGGGVRVERSMNGCNEPWVIVGVIDAAGRKYPIPDMGVLRAVIQAVGSKRKDFEWRKEGV